MTDPKQRRPVDAEHLGNSYSPDLRGRRDRSIFSVDPRWRRDASPLPSILITEPTIESMEIENCDELYTTPHGGRYPILTYPEQSPQPLGAIGQSFGYGYYYEGLCTPAVENLGKRIDCFRAAELLYLHAIARDDVHAHVGLGIIYAHDYAEGHYFDALRNNLFANLVLPEEEIRRKAYEHLRFAAAHDDVEGTYLLGDLLREGVGCEVDLDGAFQSYQTAWQKAQLISPPSNPYLGNSALRIGRAYEEGEGCECDYDIALQWYEKARMYLGEAVSNGAWFYDVELAWAKRGEKRMKQEIFLRDEPF